MVRSDGSCHLIGSPARAGIDDMETAAEILRRLRTNPKGVRFADLAAICD